MIKSQLKLLILLLVAFFFVWNPEFMANLFTQIFDIPFVAKIYVFILYSLSTVGIYSDPLTILISNVLPVLISIFVVRDVVKGERIRSDDSKHTLGFFIRDRVGVLNAILVVLALGVALLSLYALAFSLSVSINIFR